MKVQEMLTRAEYLHSNMDRLKHIFYCERCEIVQHLHSNMDRLKPGRLINETHHRRTFTFQYG